MKTIANFYFLNKIPTFRVDLNVPHNNLCKVLDNDKIIETSSHREMPTKSSPVNIIPYLQKALNKEEDGNEVFANKLGLGYVNVNDVWSFSSIPNYYYKRS